MFYPHVYLSQHYIILPQVITSPNNAHTIEKKNNKSKIMLLTFHHSSDNPSSSLAISNVPKTHNLPSCQRQAAELLLEDIIQFAAAVLLRRESPHRPTIPSNWPYHPRPTAPSHLHEVQWRGVVQCADFLPPLVRFVGGHLVRDVLEAYFHGGHVQLELNVRVELGEEFAEVVYEFGIVFLNDSTTFCSIFFFSTLFGGECSSYSYGCGSGSGSCRVDGKSTQNILHGILTTQYQLILPNALEYVDPWESARRFLVRLPGVRWFPAWTTPTPWRGDEKHWEGGYHINPNGRCRSPIRCRCLTPPDAAQMSLLSLLLVRLE